MSDERSELHHSTNIKALKGRKISARGAAPGIRDKPGIRGKPGNTGNPEYGNYTVSDYPKYII